MPALLGINCGGPDTVDPDAIAATGARWVRTVYRDNLNFRPWLQRLKDLHISTLLVGESSPESIGNNEGQWPGRMTVLRSNLGDLVSWIQVGNEPDASGIASWTMPWQRVNRLMETARAVFPRGQYMLLSPGLVSGDTNWPGQINLSLCDGLDVHPYNKDFKDQEHRDDLNGMLDRYLTYGKPLWLGEFDSRTEGLASYLRDYPGVVAAAAFCWSSAQTKAEGITGMGIKDNPAAMASFVAATGGPLAAPPPVVPPQTPATFVLGFKTFHDAFPDLIGTATEDERGGIPGFSVQRSSKGRLMAQYLASPVTQQVVGWTLTFWRDSDGARFLFSQATGDVVQIA